MVGTIDQKLLYVKTFRRDSIQRIYTRMFMVRFLSQGHPEREGGRENVGADTVTWKMVPTGAPEMNAGSALKGSDWHEVI